jgi:hypothetical protein
MPAKRTLARRTAPARRRKPAARTTTRKHPARRVKIPRRGPLHSRLGTWLVLRVVVPMVDTRRDEITARKAAAIRRITHENCTTCHGNGQIATRAKDGTLTGSKPCPAKGTKATASKWAVYKASRFGADKGSGLIGWSCPCGKKVKPRFQDAKKATSALRAHEKQTHGGASVGGKWYAQQTAAAALAPSPSTPAPKTSTRTGRARAATKTATP